MTDDDLTEPAGAPDDLAAFDPEAIELPPEGISTVDPGPITQIAGEGIDLATAPGVELLADEPES